MVHHSTNVSSSAKGGRMNRSSSTPDSTEDLEKGLQMRRGQTRGQKTEKRKSFLGMAVPNVSSTKKNVAAKPTTRRQYMKNIIQGFVKESASNLRVKIAGYVKERNKTRRQCWIAIAKNLQEIQKKSLKRLALTRDQFAKEANLVEKSLHSLRMIMKQSAKDLAIFKEKVKLIESLLQKMDSNDVQKYLIQAHDMIRELEKCQI